LKINLFSIYHIIKRWKLSNGIIKTSNLISTEIKMTKCLLLGPGKEKGLLLIGSIFVLQMKGDLVKYEKFIGVSVGALLATLIVLELTLFELYHEAIDFNIFDNLRDFNIGLLTKSSGIILPSKIQARIDFWMRKRFSKSLTFSELYQMTGKHLIIVATDNGDRDNPVPIYFDYLRTPNYFVSQAVVESCLIPGLFSTKNYSYIDGSFADPFPIQEIDENDDADAFLLKDTHKAIPSDSLVNSLEDIIDAMSITTKILIRYKMLILKRPVRIFSLKHVVKETNWRNLTGIYLNQEEKYQMVNDGILQTCKLIKFSNSD